MGKRRARKAASEKPIIGELFGRIRRLEEQMRDGEEARLAESARRLKQEREMADLVDEIARISLKAYIFAVVGDRTRRASI